MANTRVLAVIKTYILW